MATAKIASVAYQPPLATSVPTATTSTSTTTSVNFGTSTSQPGHTDTYLYYFIVPYLDAHVLSPPSWRYAYLFWIFMSAVLVLWTVYHQINRYAALRTRAHTRLNSSPNLVSSFYPFRSLHGLLGRRLIPVSSNPARTRASARQIPRWYSSTITVGQCLALLAFTAVLLALSLVGDDYISPTTCTWGGKCAVQVFKQGPPKSTYAANSRRLRARSPDLPAAPEPGYRIKVFRRDHFLRPRASALSLNPGGWAPFNDPLLAAPNTNVHRNLWTLSSRFGLLAYAMIPLVVAIGLKSWPFNLFATPWLTHYGFDRTSIIHRWTGRLIWIWSTIHTVTFSLQLSRDYNPYGRMILTDVWKYYRFNWGVAAYIALTITTCFSFNPLRNRYYELFYCSHVVLSIVFLVGCIIHYEPLWAWSVIGLVLWAAERGCRLLDWLWFNGFFAHPTQFWSDRPSALRFRSDSAVGVQQTTLQMLMSTPVAKDAVPHRYPPRSINSHATLVASPPSTPDTARGHFPLLTPTSPVDIPAGFALAQLLPGHTLRLTLTMAKPASWTIGQYVLLCIPSVHWWQTHPYTISGASTLAAADAANGTTAGLQLVLILRARQGFSKHLLDTIISRRAVAQHDRASHPSLNGVLLRCQISRPLGSSGRVAWDAFDSLIVVCGGSGISFGIAVLEEICFKMWQRSQEHLKTGHRAIKCQASRIRLVWIFREYAHLSWVAPALKRCLNMVAEDQVELDLFVSNSLRGGRPAEARKVQKLEDNRTTDTQTLLAPPRLPFLHASDSDSTIGESHTSCTGPTMELDHDELGGRPNPLVGFTDFEGEIQERTAAEVVVSASVKQEGKRRRRNTLRRQEKSRLGGLGRKQENNYKRESGQNLLGADEKADGMDETQSNEEGLGGMGVGMDISDEQRRALEELSEDVKTGRPGLEKIVEVEIGRSCGGTLVACCGPESLNSFMRTLVSQEQQKKRSFGDSRESRGYKQVEIYTEDFSY